MTIANWPPGWFRSLMGGRLPRPVSELKRSSAVDVHQFRAGHWSGARSYMHRIGRSPTLGYPGCSEEGCPASLCSLCREEPDKPGHVLLRCPALMGARHRTYLTISPEVEEVPGTRTVTALAAAARTAQSRLATRNRSRRLTPGDRI